MWKKENYFFYIFRALYTVQNSPLTKSINCVAAETFIAKNWKKLHNARQLQSTKDDYWGELVIFFNENSFYKNVLTA